MSSKLDEQSQFDFQLEVKRRLERLEEMNSDTQRDAAMLATRVGSLSKYLNVGSFFLALVIGAIINEVGFFEVFF